ncbi:MAG: hypothetical protein EOO90_03830 [Pedobacter sp.]|nr:MAG: hypothetical protein EOO90_03830 [Pedobacter sp.]
MPIKLNVPFAEKDQVKSLGAWWYAEEKAWVIPDSIKDINPFALWLPQEDGLIVKWPYIVVKAKRKCYRCEKLTTVIALGVKNYYAFDYHPSTQTITWALCEDDSVLFLEVDLLDVDFSRHLNSRYPWYQMQYAQRTGREKGWANTCQHCAALHEDDYLFSETSGVFNCLYKEDFKGISRDYLKLRFDYFISSGILYAQSNHWVLGLEPGE